MVKLTEDTKRIIKKNVGMSVEEIADTDIEEIHHRIETKIGKKLTYDDPRMFSFIGHGSVYFTFGRVLPMHVIDKELSRGIQFELLLDKAKHWIGRL